MAVALVTGALGLLVKRPGLLLLSVVGVVFAAYPAVSSASDPSLRLERRLSDPAPSPGDPVDVTVTVTNESDEFLPDVRVVDGVPPGLAVVDGFPRRGTALRGGESTTFSYTVGAARGTHGFEPATVLVRDLAGAFETETNVASEDATEIDCTAEVADAPLRARTLATIGRVQSTDGGIGTEFHQTRDYQPGDSPSRIDWNRYARTGDLTTIEFREERAATVALAVDARRVAYRGPDESPHAVSRAVSGARLLFDELVGARNTVGVAGFGREFCWLEPGSGPEHRARAHRFLTEHETFSSRRPEDGTALDEQASTFRSHLPDGAQVVLFSPLCDEAMVETVRRLELDGPAVTVIRPDPTDRGTVGRRLARVEERNRTGALRDAGVRVVTWGPDDSLAAAFDAASRRWSR